MKRQTYTRRTPCEHKAEMGDATTSQGTPKIPNNPQETRRHGRDSLRPSEGTNPNSNGKHMSITFSMPEDKAHLSDEKSRLNARTQASSLQNCERINFFCLSNLVGGTLLQ